MDILSDDLDDLKKEKSLLDNPGLVVTIINVLGASLEQGFFFQAQTGCFTLLTGNFFLLLGGWPLQIHGHALGGEDDYAWFIFDANRMW